MVLAAPLSILKDATVGGCSRSIVLLADADAPAAFLTLKCTVFIPFPALNSKDGAAEYVFHAAPEKAEDSLAI
jgi:hypothetical protein